MIFVTVGTEKFPFNRLIKAVDLAVGEGRIRDRVFIQMGNSSYVPQFVEYRDFLEFEEMMGMIRRADVVVSHAGIGSFLLCLHLGKVPILFPRRAHLGEHLDDHQMDFVKGVEKLGRALVAYDEKELLQEIERYPRLVTRLKIRVPSQVEKLAVYLEALIGAAGR
ncbi:MAG: hypothetical protein DRI92_03255 [Aquificota bacterium]|nr:MAG: hypothetical protein DRI92_03255 [Aquificota bacterium]